MRCSSPKIFHINVSHLVIPTHWINRLHTHTHSRITRIVLSRLAKCFDTEIRISFSFDFPATNQVDCMYFYAIDEILIYSSHFTWLPLTLEQPSTGARLWLQWIPLKCGCVVCICGNVSVKKTHSTKTWNRFLSRKRIIPCKWITVPPRAKRKRCASMYGLM